jgi:hypothetical protein
VCRSTQRHLGGAASAEWQLRGVSGSADSAGLRGPYVVGSKVVVVSSPLGLDDTVSDGLISALRSDPVDRLQFTAPIAVTTLLERAKVLEKDYKEWLEIAGTLANTDDEGALLARELLTAWEDNSINASADTKAGRRSMAAPRSRCAGSPEVRPSRRSGAAQRANA